MPPVPLQGKDIETRHLTQDDPTTQRASGNLRNSACSAKILLCRSNPCESIYQIRFSAAISTPPDVLFCLFRKSTRPTSFSSMHYSTNSPLQLCIIPLASSYIRSTCSSGRLFTIHSARLFQGYTRGVQVGKCSDSSILSLDI